MIKNTGEGNKMELQQRVLEAERNYFTARDAEQDHRWGESQEIAFGEACDRLHEAYEAAGTPEIDRIQL